MVKNLPANAGDTGDAGSILELGRSSGEGNDNPLQYSCLEIPMDRGGWQAVVQGVAKSWTELSMHTHSHTFQLQRGSRIAGRLEKEMATHSSTLAWRIPWLEEPSRLQSMGSQRVRLDRGTFTFHEMSRAFQWLSGEKSAASAGDTGDTGSMPGSGKPPGGGNDNPFQYSCLGNPMDRGAWWAIQSIGSQRDMTEDSQIHSRSGIAGSYDRPIFSFLKETPYCSL